MKNHRFEALDLGSLDNVTGGVELVEHIELDLIGLGSIDRYDNGAHTIWGPDNKWGRTNLPDGYFDR